MVPAFQPFADDVTCQCDMATIASAQAEGRFFRMNVPAGGRARTLIRKQNPEMTGRCRGFVKRIRMAVSPALAEVGEVVQVGVEGGPTSSSGRDDGADGHARQASTRARLFCQAQRIDRAVLAFVALGVVLRVGHYLNNYPLWGDEAFLALSFLRRGYLDLLLPLEYGQICPILFLWAELTAVKLFGFSEWSLRLCPLICGVGSVFLFRHVAGRVLRAPHFSWRSPSLPCPSNRSATVPTSSRTQPTYSWPLGCWH